MGEPLFSILIPTTGRPEFRYTLETALAQTASNYEVIVLDNAGPPEVQQTVEELGGDRVRYARSDQMLGMSENWERGLDLAKGDYVYYLGDDDGVFPDAVEIATRMHNMFGPHMVAWRPVEWHWPNYVIEPLRNVLVMRFSDRCHLEISRPILKRLFRFEATHKDLPQIYNAFVPRETIEHVRNLHGSYFLGRLPDVSSGVVNATYVHRFVQCERPLSVWGLSKNSIGTAVAYPVQTQATNADVLSGMEASKLTTENDDVLASGTCAEAWIVADMLRLKNTMLPDNPEIELDAEAMLRFVAAGAARYTGGSAYDQIVQQIDAIAARFGVDMDDVEVPPPLVRPEPWPNSVVIDAERGSARVVWYTDPAQCQTVSDVVKMVTQMSVGPSQIHPYDFPPQEPEGSGPRDSARPREGRSRRKLFRSS